MKKMSYIWMLGAGCRSLDAGYWVPDAGCLHLNFLTYSSYSCNKTTDHQQFSETRQIGIKYDKGKKYMPEVDRKQNLKASKFNMKNIMDRFFLP